MTAEALLELARSFRHAQDSKQAVPPPTQQLPWLTIDDAYAVQQLQIDARVSDGAVVRGYKIGLTSKAMQQQFGIDQPDFGHLLDGSFLPEDRLIPIANYIQPKIEPEIAFVLGSPLAGPGVTVADARRAVDHVRASLELIDSRVADWHITLVDTVADNASSAGVILGASQIKLGARDLAGVGCRFYIDQQLVAEGDGAAVMGDPVNALVWLANELGARGVSFQPGDVILPGAMTASLPVSAGSVVRAQFDGLGQVTAAFA